MTNLQDMSLQLSVCMIVRDNEGIIRQCLESIKPWVDEMVVVDTGSVDSTPEIAKALGARVFQFPWIDDFSAARNVSLEHARGRWLFWMDSDDTISPENGRKLRAIACAEHPPQVMGFVMQVHCPGSHGDATVVDHVKLIRNHPQIRFEGRIHEQVLGSIRHVGGDVEWSDVFVTHSAADYSPEGRQRKYERDLHILALDLEDRPDHPFVLFNLGMTYADMEDYAQAAAFLTRSLEVAQPDESHVRKAYALLANAHMQLGRQEDAAQALADARRHYPDDVELRFREAMLLHEAGKLSEAVEAYHATLSTSEERHFSSIDPGVAGYKARHNLAVVFTDMGRLDLAEVQLRRALRELPSYRPSARALAENLIVQQKLESAEVTANSWEQSDTLRCEAHLLRAAICRAQGDLEDARSTLAEAVSEFPNDPDALQAHCRFLFEHGDPKDAQAALESLIALCPTDGAARHNLGAVLMHRQYFSEAIAAFQESLQIRPHSPHTMLQLGYAFRGAGDDGNAKGTWEEAKALFPGDPSFGAALAELSGGGS